MKSNRTLLGLSFKQFKVISILIIFIALVSYGLGDTFADQQQPSISATSSPTMLTLINDVRALNGVAPLIEDSGLDSTAKLKAEDLAGRNYFTHTTPDNVPFYTLIQQNRAGLKQAGENLAECYTNNETMIAAWIASPGHFENIIKPEYTLFGSASTWDEDRKCIVTVNHFGQ